MIPKASSKIRDHSQLRHFEDARDLDLSNGIFREMREMIPTHLLPEMLETFPNAPFPDAEDDSRLASLMEIPKRHFSDALRYLMVSS
ncbi:hypothetical protein CYMTET_35804 [Cymbomonas tetramitiformis]|uniref:Uncharacterized protein n=1 Tax=Cymbomonas tetramitiformis TaxID=36881 RepID=A0AAE0KNA5_9CHLO|nr:hypothetical protein CYMTET_35804 [Cymbomonas tetramitiformis]